MFGWTCKYRPAISILCFFPRRPFKGQLRLNNASPINLPRVFQFTAGFRHSWKIPEAFSMPSQVPTYRQKRKNNKTGTRKAQASRPIKTVAFHLLGPDGRFRSATWALRSSPQPPVGWRDNGGGGGSAVNPSSCGTHGVAGPANIHVRMFLNYPVVSLWEFVWGK